MIRPVIRARAANAIRHKRSALVFAALVLALIVGCRDGRVETVYGVRGGIGKESINGTAVLAEMFRAAGHHVVTSRRISPRLHKYDVIVWAPDDFAAPDLEQRIALEDWLSTGARTLIYVGRDYDAAPHYWERMANEVGGEQAIEMWRRRAVELGSLEEERTLFGTTEYARWFTRHGGKEYGRVTTVSAEDPEFLSGIDTSRLELYLGTTLEPAAAQDIPAPSPKTTGFLRSFDEDLIYESPEEQKRQRTIPSDVQVLVNTDRGPLITRVKDFTWQQSTIYVVANGCFLLNMPLVNPEHRKLAGKLISACGEPKSVAFLQTNPYDIVYFADSSDSQPTGLEVFTVWPLGLIVMHAFVVGIIACFAMFPIFGRAREVPTDSRGDFGRHIEALGKLLQRTRDEIYAREQLQQYYRHVRGDPGAAKDEP